MIKEASRPASIVSSDRVCRVKSKCRSCGCVWQTAMYVLNLQGHLDVKSSQQAPGLLCRCALDAEQLRLVSRPGAGQPRLLRQQLLPAQPARGDQRHAVARGLLRPHAHRRRYIPAPGAHQCWSRELIRSVRVCQRHGLAQQCLVLMTTAGGVHCACYAPLQGQGLGLGTVSGPSVSPLLCRKCISIVAPTAAYPVHACRTWDVC